MVKNKKVTLKDISNATGYSLVSIHRAIYNKEGLNEESRQNILKTVHEMGYKINYFASSLKRKNMTVAYVGRRREAREDYHSMMADGAKSAFYQYEGMNLTLKEYYFDGEYSELEDKEVEILDRIYQSETIDGLILFPLRTGIKTRLATQKLVSKGIPVVLVDDFFDNMDFLSCVAPDARAVGRTAAEFMSSICRPGKILVSQGNPNSVSHKINCLSFGKYLKESGCDYELEFFENDLGEKDLVERLRSSIDGSVVGIYAGCETDSSAICEAYLKSGYSDIKLIGNDLGLGNRRNIENGVLFAVIDTDPFMQGYVAMRKLLDCILRNIKPESKFYSSPISVVMRSNLPCRSEKREYGVPVSAALCFDNGYRSMGLPASDKGE